MSFYRKEQAPDNVQTSKGDSVPSGSAQSAPRNDSSKYQVNKNKKDKNYNAIKPDFGQVVDNPGSGKVLSPKWDHVNKKAALRSMMVRLAYMDEELRPYLLPIILEEED